MSHQHSRPRRLRPRRLRPRRIQIEPLEPRTLLAADLLITEIMASNDGTLLDEDGTSADWIEIHNPGDDPVDLRGWSLTDDLGQLDKWKFPEITIDPGEYLVVFASAKDRAYDSYRLTSDFHSTPDGTFLVDLPAGQYEVRVTLGDAARDRDDVAVYVQGTEVDTVSTAQGTFIAQTYPFQIDGDAPGHLALRLVDRGGQTNRATVNAVIVRQVNGDAAWRFDFGTADSPLEDGFLPVTVQDVYTPAAGYGWQEGTVVGARDRGLEADHLHTNFKLRSRGEQVALVSPGGDVVSAIDPDGSAYPEQFPDVAYGLANDEQLLLDPDRAFSYRVPTAEDAAVAGVWPQAGFDDASWSTSEGVGVSRGVGAVLPGLVHDYQAEIETDLADRVIGKNASLWIRQPFVVDEVDSIRSLVLRVKYDDGFAAYLNGVRVAAAAAPRSLDWNTTATESRNTRDALRFVDFDVTAYREALIPGENILAIAGLNRVAADSDMLIVPQLIAARAVDPATAPVGNLARPTPGTFNAPLRGPAVAMDRASGIFREPFDLSLTADVPGAVIHYTTDGTTPTARSPVFDAATPLRITDTVFVRAVAALPGRSPGQVASAWYVALDADLTAFDSNLPVVLLEHFGSGPLTPVAQTVSALAIYEPGGAEARTTLDGAPQIATRAGVKVRGSNSASKPKKPFAVEAWDEHNRDTDIAPLGMPANSDWILFSPYDTDVAMLRNSFIFDISNQMGRYAVRTRFVELFQNMEDGNLSMDDYRGVYVLMEKVKRGPGRVDIAELKPEHEKEPEITGGWLLKIDRADPGDRGFVAGGQGVGPGSERLRYVDPKEEDVTPAQAQWIRSYIDQMAASLGNPDPDTGYPHYIDVDAWIDHHILNTFAKNVDGLRLSTFLYKDRGGKLAFGPVWDFDRSIDSPDARDDLPTTWNGDTRYFDPDTRHPWWGTLFANEEFTRRWWQRWRQLRENVLSDQNIAATIDRLAAEIEEAQVRNFARWPELKPRTGDSPATYDTGKLDGTWRGEVEHMKAWLRERMNWMDGQSPLLDEETELVISEFMASNQSSLEDEDRLTSDWIEIHNKGDQPVSLDGWYLTDSANRLDKWRFPDVTVAAGGYLVVFASGKNRTDPAGQLHTNFKLRSEGEYLGLVRPDLTVAHDFGPVYPPQRIDVSYGFSPGSEEPGYLAAATPGGENSLLRAARVEIDQASRMFREPFQVTLSVDAADAVILYTTDGSQPRAQTSEPPGDGAGEPSVNTTQIYTGPITVEQTTLLQAIAVAPGRAPSGVASRWYTRLDPQLAAFDSNLPVFVIDNFGAGAVSDSAFQLNALAIFEPDAASGRTTLAADPTLESRVGLKVRGSNSAGKPKRHYALEAWDENNRDRDIEPLGLPAESDWILFPPYDTDQSLMSNSLIFELSNEMGRYASRTRFVELYHNTDGGDLAPEDYQGVYVLMEKIKRGPNRVDVTELRPQDNQEPEITGGWMLKIDRPDPDNHGFVAGNHELQYVDPKEEAVTPEQAAWIKNYIDQMKASLTNRDPETGYAQYIDVDAWIDHHILNVLASNNDGLKLSTYLYKERGGKLAFGPIWDFDRAFGHDEDDHDSEQTRPDQWQGNRHTHFFNFSWWGTLFEDPNFMQRWIDRWFELRKSVFSEDNINRLIDTMKGELDEAQVRNFQRWPEVRPDGGLFAPPDMQDWDGEILNLRNWILLRLAWIDSQFVQPPTIVPDGGTLGPGERVELGPAAQQVYYTTDGSDPRAPGGQIAPTAKRFGRVDTLVGAGAPVAWKIPAGTPDESEWETPAYDASSWSTGTASLGYDTGTVDSTAPFTVREVHSTGTINRLADADALLAGQGVARDDTVTGVTSINYVESTGEGHFQPSAAFPGGGGNDFAVRATTQLVIDQAGIYTFGVHTDDGLRLSIDGEPLIVDDSIHRPQDSLASTLLEAGTHSLELVTFDRSGSSGLELFWAPGQHTAFSEAFTLLSASEKPYAPLIGTDLGAPMRGTRAGAYVRIPFTVANVDDVLRLLLRVQYDDGFIAYLNGSEVARRNAPSDVAFDSAATATHADSLAIRGDAIDLTQFKGLLRNGENLLAIHGLNASADDPDFFLAPRLEATVVDQPVTLAGTTTVTARTLVDGNWSAPVTAFFAEEPFADASNLRITEVQYHPARSLPVLGELDVDRDEFEFIELQNIGSETIDLGGAALVEAPLFNRSQGVRFTFDAQQLAPGERIVVVENRRAFESRYGKEIRIALGRGDGAANGEYAGKLANEGEQLKLVDRFGQTIQTFVYGVRGPWPERARGGGSSLEVVDVAGDYYAPDNWRASDEYGGSPGRAGEVVQREVVINEVLPGGDDVELANVTGGPIDVSGWFLSSDAGDLTRGALEAARIVPPHGYLVVPGPDDETDAAAAKDRSLWLVAADDRGRPAHFADRVDLVPAAPTASLGRWPDRGGSGRLVPLSVPTAQAPNRRPATGPLLISEIHYQPAALADVAFDFSSVDPPEFETIRGNWQVAADRYQATPVAAGEDAVAVLSSLAALTSQYDLQATVRVPSATTFNKNAALIFDYRGPEDFKFASIHQGGGKVRIGQRDADRWQFLDEASVPLALDTDLRLELSIRGSQVTVSLDGQKVLEHDFDKPVYGGRVGLGTKGGEAQFDDVLVRRLAADDYEFLELAAVGAEAVDLAGWRVGGTVQWDFPPETTVAPGNAVVLVGFDPQQSALTEGFRSLYAIDRSVTLAGPFDGKLGNGGGSIELLRPLAGQAGGDVLGPVDRVDYATDAPWPVQAAGGGTSLTRTAEHAFGLFASSWLGRGPTAGRAALAADGDLNFDGQVDGDDLNAFVLGLLDPERYADQFAAPPLAAGDMDRDGDLDYDDIGPLAQQLAAARAAEAGSAAVTAARREAKRGALERSDDARIARPNRDDHWDRLAERVFARSLIDGAGW